MKVAIVHDWLPVYGGAERVLEQILQVFPDADVFSMVDLIPKGERKFLLNKAVTTSFLQKNAWVRSHYRLFLPLMPLAVEQFDLAPYELVISSSYAIAKGVLTSPGQLHICYCHSPMRYAWDMQHRYLKESKLTRGPASWLARTFLHFLRMWDVQTHQRVDHFLTNSEFVRGRIRKFYGRDATVVYPPVDINRFSFCASKDDYYVTASRMVPYKMVGLIVDAFARCPDRELRVIGDGPEFEAIKRRAPSNVKMLGYQPAAVLHEQLQRAKAFVFAAEEDFGIAPLEAQACGTPVIAFGKGGALETIISNKTGLFFREQTVESLCEAIARFEESADAFEPAEIRAHAEKFGAARFREQLYDAISARWWASGRDPEVLDETACLDPEESEASEPAGVGTLRPTVDQELPVLPASGRSGWAQTVAEVRAALF